MLTLMLALSITLSSPTLSINHCYTVSELPDLLTWQMGRTSFIGQFLDPVAGCTPTAWGTFEAVSIVSDNTTTTATLDRSLLPTCGHGQIDFRGDEADALTYFALFNTGVDCSPWTPPVTPFCVENCAPPPPVPVPEPSTGVLVASGVVLVRRWLSGRGIR